ncbi:MAG: hypothetical protein ACLSA6_07655 [Holdemania massiliensis]
MPACSSDTHYQSERLESQASRCRMIYKRSTTDAHQMEKPT